MTITVNFVGTPRSGSIPLVVDFVADVKFDGKADNSKVLEYRWYFDYDNYPEVYKTSLVPTITYCYNAHYGKKFSVKLVIIPTEPEPTINFNWICGELVEDVTPIDYSYQYSVGGVQFFIPPLVDFKWTCDSLPVSTPVIDNSIQAYYGIQFLLKSTTGVTSIVWDFGDGHTDNKIIPDPHVFNNDGNYNISIVINGNVLLTISYPLLITSETS